MIFLVDHNIELHAEILSGNIANLGWLELLPIEFVTFEKVRLSVNSDDRIVWRFAQANQMILLTANRSMEGQNSLEKVMREENTSTSLPVITIGNADRLLNDKNYLNLCVDSLLEIVMYIDDYRGSMRLFIP